MRISNKKESISEDYTIKIHETVKDEYSKEAAFPFRFCFMNIPNIREQSVKAHYTVSLGIQK